MMERKHIGSVIVTRGTEMVGIFTEGDMINRIISKGLDPKDTLIGDVCSRQLLTISSDTSCRDALLKMQTNSCKRLLVYEGTQFLGIVKMQALVASIALEEKRNNFVPNLLAGLTLIIVLMVIGSGREIIALVAWLLIAITIAFDLSARDLARLFNPLFVVIKNIFSRRAANKEKAPSADEPKDKKSNHI